MIRGLIRCVTRCVIGRALRSGVARLCQDQPVADDCPFCLIAAGRLAASVVHESERVLAFMDIDPVTPGHVLVVPREHLAGLADLPDPIGGEMFAVARAVAVALRRTDLRCEGVNLFFADGEAALQEVPHAHLHVIPRFEGDGFAIAGRWGSDPSRAELDAHAASIRRALTAPS